jgi:transketolase
MSGADSNALQAGGRPVPVKSTARERIPQEEPERLEDVGFMTAMVINLLGNYANTGHFGGPLAYTPFVTSIHLIPPELGGLRYDIREPKHPYGDKYLMTGGHCTPANYALWMILYEAMARQYEATGQKKYRCDPGLSVLAIDALGFRRSHGALKNLLARNKLSGHPLFRQAKPRGIRALAGHSESTDVTNDVNGGPSGIGVATAAGKAFFWNFLGAPEQLKVIAVEGEFAMTEGHAQEIKTIALAQEVGKRLRIFLSFNNAGIDDHLIGPAGVIEPRYKGYQLAEQWSSYGWHVLSMKDGNDYAEIAEVLRTMEQWPADDGRPMVVIGPTVKGWWPGMAGGRIPGIERDPIVGYPSHPYGFGVKVGGKHDPYVLALAGTYERKYGIRFEGLNDTIQSEADRLVQFKTNIDIALSVMDRRKGMREWITDRLIETAGKLDRTMPLAFPNRKDPFEDPRLKVRNLPTTRQRVSLKDPHTGKTAEKEVDLFLPAGEKKGCRRAISEIGKWMNYVSGNRFITIAADLSHSINVEDITFFGHYKRFSNPAGTRMKAAIQEAGNASTMIGIVNQTISPDPKRHCGLWGITGTYGAFTPLMYLPARVFSQQNQDSPFALGVLTILSGHSGPETAADARTHFGIFAPQVWNLFPKGQIINLHCWDYNDVAPSYFAAVEQALKRKELGVIVIHVARPDTPVVDRRRFADRNLKAAARGAYVIRDFKPGRPKQGYLLVQGASSTTNTVRLLDRLEQEGINVKIISVVSEDLFRLQPKSYRERVFPPEAYHDCTFITTGTKRVPPFEQLPPPAEAYSLSADWDDRWRTGGTEADVIAEARLDETSIYKGIVRFARDRKKRLAEAKKRLARLR